MRKAFFILLFVFLATAVFAQLEEIYTSEGVYYVPKNHPSYMGKYKGQEEYLSNLEASRGLQKMGFILSINTNEKLSRGQLECIQKLLSRYETTRGDTFFIRIMFSTESVKKLEVYCEFTSNTGFTYWVYSTWDR
jgi:hypothetical protein